jgi:hypothetical protein
MSRLVTADPSVHRITRISPSDGGHDRPVKISNADYTSILDFVVHLPPSTNETALLRPSISQHLRFRQPSIAARRTSPPRDAAASGERNVAADLQQTSATACSLILLGLRLVAKLTV